MMLILLVGVSKLLSTRRTRRRVDHRSGRAGFCGRWACTYLGCHKWNAFRDGKTRCFQIRLRPFMNVPDGVVAMTHEVSPINRVGRIWDVSELTRIIEFQDVCSMYV
jgi:hypothetical protein